MNPAGTLEALGDRVAGEDQLLAAHVIRSAEVPAFGELVAAGPRAAASPAGYALVVEAVREGYLCHYSTPRVLDRADADLVLLAGDLFYAIGISDLAGLEDPESVGILSDLIRNAAEFRAVGETERAEALWMAQLLALGWDSGAGGTPLIEALKRRERGSVEALGEWSLAFAAEAGAGREFDRARKAIDLAPANT